MADETDVVEACLVEQSSERMLSLVYDELRRLARRRLAQEPAGQTLQATALVHEAYLRLVKSAQHSAWNSPGHFYCAAAEAMRRILVESARRKQRVKHGGEYVRIEPSESLLGTVSDHEEILAINEVLDDFAKLYPQKAALVKMRYFGGYTLEESAELMEISPSTAKRHWQFAKAWLYARLAGSVD
jgi:RNA polymerase sigma factor (TIGR02999 family)